MKTKYWEKDQNLTFSYR